MSNEWKAQTVTAASAILSLENMQSAFIKAAQHSFTEMQKSMIYALWKDHGPFITINKWYGSDTRSVIRLKFNDKDKGTILIHWKK